MVLNRLLGYGSRNAELESKDGVIVRRSTDARLSNVKHVDVSGCGSHLFVEAQIGEYIRKGYGWFYLDCGLGDRELRQSIVLGAEHARRTDDLYVVNFEATEQSESYNPLLSGTSQSITTRLLMANDMPVAGLPMEPIQPHVYDALQALVSAFMMLQREMSLPNLMRYLNDLSKWSLLVSDLPLGHAVRNRLQDSMAPWLTDIGGLNHEAFRRDAAPLSARMMRLVLDLRSQGILGTMTPSLSLANAIKDGSMVYMFLPGTRFKPALRSVLARMIFDDLDASLRFADRGNHPEFRIITDEPLMNLRNKLF